MYEHSFKNGKQDIKKWLIENFETNSRIIDCGVGVGTYSALLKDDFNNIDGIEVFEPCVELYDLKNKYNNLFVENVMDCKNILSKSNYDIAIFGDVIEHLSVDEAQDIINHCINEGLVVVVSVPYMHKNEPQENPYQYHIQSDLTDEIFRERYPKLTLFKKYFSLKENMSVCGYYVWKPEG
jgi:predicted TPR repeat methyltransferase